MKIKLIECCITLMKICMLYYFILNLEGIQDIRRQSESAFVYGSSFVDSLISLSCIMPAYTYTPRHFIERKALWDTCRKIGREITPTKSHRILLNYRVKVCKPKKKHIQRFLGTCKSTISHLKIF